MVIKIDRKAVAFNINKAENIAVGIPVSIMLKGFYEYIADIECVSARKIYSQGLKNSVCYALHSATSRHSGAVIADFDDFMECYRSCNIREFYVPLNADDDREGLDMRLESHYANHPVCERRKALYYDYLRMPQFQSSGIATAYQRVAIVGLSII